LAACIGEILMLPRLIRSQIVKGLNGRLSLMDMDGSLQILPGENDKNRFIRLMSFLISK
jgi:hypothetical protein